MNKKLLIGIIVVFVIAAAIWARALFPSLLFKANVLFQYLFLGVWIYLVWMVRKKKISLFRDQMEQKLAERRYRMLKAFLLVAGISLAAFIVNLVLHIAIFGPTEEEGAVMFYIALFSHGTFIIATIGGLVIFLKGRRKTT